jgi:SAM-dependent methyltransferase
MVPSTWSPTGHLEPCHVSIQLGDVYQQYGSLLGSKMRCETVEILADGRTVSPSAERNKGPIAEVLRRVLPAQGEVLEVSSGTGQHVVHFAEVMPHLRWLPTERDADSLKSIANWLKQTSAPNVSGPLRLDVYDAIWPAHDVAAVVCINMIHIAAPSAAEALLRGAGKVIAPGGALFLYGPYRRHGRHTSPSNQAFDEQLKAKNPAWGVRDLEDVVHLASAAGLELEQTHDMPANNLAIVFRRRRRGPPYCGCGKR